MRPYGYSRKDSLSCSYGCCGLVVVRTHRSPRTRKACDRAARKRARREAKKILCADY